MSQENLRTHLQKFYASKQPPKDLIATIQKQVAAASWDTPKKAPPPNYRWGPTALALAAGVLLGAFGIRQRSFSPASSPAVPPVVSVPLPSPSQSTGSEIVLAKALNKNLAEKHYRELAARAANHHVRCYIHLDPALQTISDAQEKLPGLGFHLIEPAVLKKRGFKILGARRCMYFGEVAAEVRVKDPKGKLGTLMVSRIPKEVSGFAPPVPLARTVDGIHIELWKESGLFVAFAVPV